VPVLAALICKAFVVLRKEMRVESSDSLIQTGLLERRRSGSEHPTVLM
jgi:hypothetical protein